MKRILTGVLALFMGASVAMAQTDAPAKPKQDKPKTEKQAPSKDGKGDKHMKKDGTPDKRFKENKDGKAPEGPKKKDGTPDKRFKENKGKDGKAPAKKEGEQPKA